MKLSPVRKQQAKACSKWWKQIFVYEMQERKYNPVSKEASLSYK
jgi:hypothetical protein